MTHAQNPPAFNPGGPVPGINDRPSYGQAATHTQASLRPLFVPTSGLATASLVLGILGMAGGWLLLGLPCLAAIILGHMANKETGTGQRPGHALTVAGLMLGYLAIAPAVLMFVIFVLGVGGMAL